MPTKTKTSRKTARKTAVRKPSSARKTTVTRKRRATVKHASIKRKKSVFKRLLGDSHGSISGGKLKKSSRPKKFKRSNLVQTKFSQLVVVGIVVVGGLSWFAFSLASTAISVSISGVTSGGTFPSPITVSAVAHNTTPVSIAFYLDGNHFGTRTTSPYCMNGGDSTTCWPYTIANGTHTVKVIMTVKVTSGNRRHPTVTYPTYTSSITFKVGTKTTSTGSGSTSTGSGSTSTGSGSTSTGSGSTSTGSGSTSTGSGSTSTGSGSTSTGSGSTSTGSGSTSNGTSSSTAMTPPSGYTSSELSFDDQFTGTSLNTNNWNTYITSNAAAGYPWNTNGLPSGDSSEAGANGNAEDYCAPSQVSVDNGLNLSLVPNTSESGYTYKTGCVTSYGHFQLTSGYVQFKVKMPADLSLGGWPALWFLPGPGGKGGDRGEIDLFEGGFTAADMGLSTNVPEDEVFASHYDAPSDGWVAAGYNTGVDMTAGYNIYGMEYIPGVSIKTFFNGHMVGDWTTDINTDPYEIIINNSEASSATTGWHSLGTPPNPSEMSVAEVQAYN